MIIQETYELNGQMFVRTYSDAHRYVVGGVPYAEYTEANDPAIYNRTYVEGDLIPEEEISNDECFDIIFGGEQE